ncbi:hypothetical protein SRHO_G00202740 [Serrasalmus rhombeus]
MLRIKDSLSLFLSREKRTVLLQGWPEGSLRCALGRLVPVMNYERHPAPQVPEGRGCGGSDLAGGLLSGEHSRPPQH